MSKNKHRKNESRGKKPEIKKKNRCTQSNCGKMSDVTYSASTQAPSAQWVGIFS